MSKEEGNEHLKAGRLAEAIACYAAALAATGLSSDDAAAIHANRALAHLKRSEYAPAVSDCDAALAVQPRYVKALFRRAQAREGLADLAAAFRDVQTLLQIDPTNREARALAQRLRLAIAARAASTDLSAPRAAVEALVAATSPDDRARCAAQLSRIARDPSNVPALLHAGAVPPLLALLPTADAPCVEEVATAVVGLAVEALERIAASDIPPKDGSAHAGWRAASSEARTAIGTGATSEHVPKVTPDQPLPKDTKVRPPTDSKDPLPKEPSDPLRGSVAARLLRLADACARGSVTAAAAGQPESPKQEEKSKPEEGSGLKETSGQADGDGRAGAQGAAAGAAAGAVSGASQADASQAGGGLAPSPADRPTVCESTAGRCLSLLSLLGSCRAAVGSQDAQAAILREILPFTRLQGAVGLQGASGGAATEGVDTPSPLRRSALDAVLRMSDLDAPACRLALPQVLSALMWRVGDDETEDHRAALAIIGRLLTPVSARRGEGGGGVGKGGGGGAVGEVDKADEDAFTQSCCSACQIAFSPILRGTSAAWDETVAAIHGVSAVIEANKAVGAWLLRQESIFWSLAEVAEMEDEGLQRALAEIYAHAAADPVHFKGKEGEEPIKHLK
eukprot:scaffold5182_cov111-Isochrysis_galbana.AAC.1